MGKYGGPSAGRGVIRDPVTTREATAQGMLVRELLVGFYHGIGLEDTYSDKLNQSEYRFRWSQAGAQTGAGTFFWEPSADNIADIEAESITGEGNFGAFNRMLAGGRTTGGGAAPGKGRAGAAHWSPEFDGSDDWSEQVKKDILPTVAWNDAEYRGEFLNLGPMGTVRKNDGDSFTSAKRYTWRWIANKKSGWGGGRVPTRDALGLFEDYTRLIRTAGLGKIQPQANLMMQNLLQSISNNFTTGVNKLVVQSRPSTGAGSVEEMGLRLWPYIRDNLDTNMSMQQILLTGTADYEAARRAGTDIGRRQPMVKGAEGFDLTRDMAVWNDIDQAILNSASVGFSQGLQDNVETTEQVNRVLGRYRHHAIKTGGTKVDVDWDDPASRQEFAIWMDNQITKQIISAISEGRGPLSRPAGNDQTGFEFQAARRYMNYEMGSGGGSYTWIEPVTGGIGLYNVFLAPDSTSERDLVEVQVGFISSNTGGLLKLLMQNANTQRSYSQIRSSLESLYRSSTMSIFRRAYQVRLNTTARLAAGSTGLGVRSADFERRQMFQTYASITPVDELVEAVFEWATSQSWDIASNLVSNATDRPGRNFRQWQRESYSQIATFGQKLARDVTPGKYRSWVRDDLTTNKKGQGYGKLGSKQRFLDYLGKPFPYQPKPFAWMKRITGQGPAQEN